jgi:hypothetical protein
MKTSYTPCHLSWWPNQGQTCWVCSIHRTEQMFTVLVWNPWKRYHLEDLAVDGVLTDLWQIHLVHTRGISVGLLWWHQWTFTFPKMWGISWLPELLKDPGSMSQLTLLISFKWMYVHACVYTHTHTHTTWKKVTLGCHGTDNKYYLFCGLWYPAVELKKVEAPGFCELSTKLQGITSSHHTASMLTALFYTSMWETSTATDFTKRIVSVDHT